MSLIILNQIVEQLETLDLKELEELNQIIQKYLRHQEKSVNKTDFHQALIQSGLVKKINHPNYPRIENRQLIKIQGEPISETIIKERR